jgi:3-mercaptopropionate dioxygenase
MTGIAPLRRFVQEMTGLVDRHGADEETLRADGAALLARLVASDGWLPDAFAAPHPMRYCQYLLHCDPLERFSVVSFVWGPGQSTPIHDHTVWGLIGMLRGAERSLNYIRESDSGRLARTGEELLTPGMVTALSPAIGDIHAVANALADAPSISIHVYGANIGAVARHVFDADTGVAKDFVSGYSSEAVPNLWDRSMEIRNPS